MAMLTLGATVIPIDMAEMPEVEVQYVEIGDRGRSIDGTDLSDIQARKEEIPVITRPLTSAEATTVFNALTAATPIAAAGDLVGGTYNCSVQITARHVLTTPAGRRYRYAFTIRQL